MGSRTSQAITRRPRARVLTLLSLLALSVLAIHVVQADPWAVPSWNRRAPSGSDAADGYAASDGHTIRKDANANAEFQAVNSPAPVVESSSSSAAASTAFQVMSSSSSLIPTTSIASAAATTAPAGPGGIYPFLPSFLQPAPGVTSSSSSSSTTGSASATGTASSGAQPPAATASAPGIQRRDTDFLPVDWIPGDTRSGNPMDGPDVGTPNIIISNNAAPLAPVPQQPQGVPMLVDQQPSSSSSTVATTSVSTSTAFTVAATSAVTSTTDTTATSASVLTATSSSTSALNINSIIPNVPIVSGPATPIPTTDASPIQPRRVSSNPVDLRGPGYMPGLDSQGGEDPATGPGAAFVPIQGGTTATLPGAAAPPGATASAPPGVQGNLQNTDMYPPGYVQGLDSPGGGNPARGPDVGRPLIKLSSPRDLGYRRPRRKQRDDDDEDRDGETLVADVLRGIERELFGDARFSLQHAGADDGTRREHAVASDGEFDAVYDEREVEVVEQGRSRRRGRSGRGRESRNGNRKAGLRLIGNALRQALSRARRRGDFRGAEQARQLSEELASLTQAYQKDVREARKNKNRGMAKRVAKQFLQRMRALRAKGRGLLDKYGKGRRPSKRNNGIKSSKDLKNMISKLAVQVKRDHTQVKAELKQQDERLIQLVNDLVQGRQARADQVRLAVMSLHEALRKVGLQLARYEAKHAAQDRRQLEKLNALDYQYSSLKEANKVGSDTDKARREVEIAEIQSKRSLLNAQRASRQAKLIEVRSRARAVQASVKAFVKDLRRRAKEGPGSTEVKASEEAIERIRKELDQATRRVSGTALVKAARRRRPVIPSAAPASKRAPKEVRMTVAPGPRGHKQLVHKINAIIRDGRRVRKGLLKRGNAQGQIRVRVRLGRLVAETKLWHDASLKQLNGQRKQAGEQSEVQVQRLDGQITRHHRLHAQVQKRIQRAVKVVGQPILPGSAVPAAGTPKSRRQLRKEQRNARRNAAKARRDARRNTAKATRDARKNARKARQQQRKNRRRGRK